MKRFILTLLAFPVFVGVALFGGGLFAKHFLTRAQTGDPVEFLAGCAVFAMIAWAFYAGFAAVRALARDRAKPAGPGIPGPTATNGPPKRKRRV